jgi:hypothetical protein
MVRLVEAAVTEVMVGLRPFRLRSCGPVRFVDICVEPGILGDSVAKSWDAES